MNRPDFLRWFNRGFWKAFTRSTFPIEIPKTPAEKAALLESVYDDIASARYAPGIPETELVMNKGYGVARTGVRLQVQAGGGRGNSGDSSP